MSDETWTVGDTEQTDDDIFETGVVSTPPTGEVIAFVYGSNAEESVLRARLIAAAPRMLAAMKQWERTGIINDFQELVHLVREAGGCE